MSIVTRRPNAVFIDGPFTSIEGGAGSNTLGDQNDNTYVSLKPFGTTRAGYPAMVASEIPAGRQIIAPRVVHRYNYAALQWILPALRAPESWLLRNGQRIPSSGLYSPDGSALYGNVNQAGPIQVKNDYTPWTLAEINELSTEHLSRAAGADYIDLPDVGIDVIISEPLTVTPTLQYPANSSTIATSNVNFSTKLPTPQSYQGIRAVFQVARDAAFTTSLKTFYSSFSFGTDLNSLVTYNGVWDQPSNTDLDPGMWYIRVKGVDVVSQSTAWSATTSFTITHAALPAPSLNTPTPGSIQVTPYGIRKASPGGTPSDNRSWGVEFNFSKSSTFASGIVSFATALKQDVTPISYDSEGIVSQYLTQGVWYARVRSKDKWGQGSSWSSTQSFTVSHPPLAINTSPTSNGVIDQDKTPLSWSFADSWENDGQTAYQVKIYDESNALIKDSGKTLSSSTRSYFPALANSYRFRPGLKWTVALWDKDDIKSVSLTNNYFKLSISPQTVLPYPAQNETVLTGQPTISWTPGVSAPAFQNYYSLVIKRSDGLTVFESYGTGQTGVTPPQIVLKNATDYILTLAVRDSDGLSTTIVRNFRAEYQSPPEVNFTTDYLAYGRDGYVNIDWSLFSPDQYFIEWRVYRREMSSSDYELISIDSNSSHRSYRDWLVPANKNYQYVVTQVADRSGYALESYLDPDAPSGLVVGEDYWLIVPSDMSKNFRAASVSSDSFSDEVETKVEVVIGRGRRVNYGTRLGISGTLTVKLRGSAGMTATEQRAALGVLRDSMHAVLLRDPFGSITKVAIGDAIGYDRLAGVGNAEFADVTIPYQEVF